MDIPAPDMSPAAELARLKASFPYFLRRSWVWTGRHKKFPLSWVDYDIAYYLGDKSVRQKVLMCHRFRGKSTILEAYCAWNFLRNGDITIKVISKEDEAAAQYIRGLRRSWFMACPYLQHLIPKATNDQSKKKADGASRMDVATRDMGTGARESSIVSKGVTGHKTGGRAHILIPDDIETPENTKTQKARDELFEAFGEFSNIATYSEDPKLYPAGEILVAGTPHCEQTVYYKLADLGYDIRVIPLIVPDNPESYPHLSPAILRRVENGRLKPGDLVSPRSHGPAFVARQKATQSRRTFLMQQMLQAIVPPDQTRLQVKDLIYDPDMDRLRGPVTIRWGTTRGHESTQSSDVPCYGYDGDGVYEAPERSDETSPYEGARMWIDPSGAGADKTAWAVFAALNGKLFLTSAGEHTGGYSEEARVHLVMRARECGVDLIAVEDNFGQGMFAELLKQTVEALSLKPGEDPRYPNGWSCQVQSVRITRMSGDKLQRTYRTLAPLVESHRIVVGPEVLRLEQFQVQLTRLDPDRQTLEHDDLIEAVAGAAGLWVSEASVDPEAAAAAHLERLRRDRLLAEIALMEAVPAGTGYDRWVEHRR